LDYWDVHTDLVIKLREVGVAQDLAERIPVFKTYRELTKLARAHPETADKADYLKEGLEYILLLRQNGLEPPVAKGTNKYTDNKT
jgi:hypothetical protein